MGSNHEKTGGRKSLDTLPLTAFNDQSYNMSLADSNEVKEHLKLNFGCRQIISLNIPKMYIKSLVIFHKTLLKKIFWNFAKQVHSILLELI